MEEYTRGVGNYAQAIVGYLLGHFISCCDNLCGLQDFFSGNRKTIFMIELHYLTGINTAVSCLFIFGERFKLTYKYLEAQYSKVKTDNKKHTRLGILKLLQNNSLTPLQQWLLYSFRFYSVNNCVRPCGPNATLKCTVYIKKVSFPWKHSTQFSLQLGTFCL